MLGSFVVVVGGANMFAVFIANVPQRITIVGVNTGPLLHIPGVDVLTFLNLLVNRGSALEERFVVRGIGHAVLVETDVETDIPTPIFGLDGLYVEAILDTLVANRTGVLKYLEETGRGSYGNAQQQTGIVGVVEVDRHINALDKGQVNTNGSHVGFLPTQSRVAQAAGNSHGLVLVLLIQTISRKELISGDVVVTGYTIAGTEFQETNHFLVFHKVLVGDQPRSSDRGEIVHTFLGAEYRTLLCTESSGDEVTLSIVVTSLNEGSPAGTRHVVTGDSQRHGGVESVHAVRHTFTTCVGVVGLPNTILEACHTVYGVGAPLVSSFQDIGSTEGIGHINRVIQITFLIACRIAARVNINSPLAVAMREAVAGLQRQPIGKVEVELQVCSHRQAIALGVVVLGIVESVPLVLRIPRLTIVRTNGRRDVHEVTVLIVGVIPRHLGVCIIHHNPRCLALSRGAVEISTNFQIQPFEYLGVQVNTARIFLITGVDEGTVLLVVVKRSIVAELLSTTCYRDVVVLRETVLEEIVLPVVIFIKQGAGAQRVEDRRRIHGLVVVVQFFGVHHLVVTKQRLSSTNSGTYVDTRFLVAATLLGGNNDDTTCSGGTVDTRGTCVLQHRDSLHVVGVELSTHDTINYVNGVCSCGN